MPPGRRFGGHAREQSTAAVQGVEVRDAAQHPVTCKRAPQGNCPAQDVGSAKAEKTPVEMFQFAVFKGPTESSSVQGVPKGLDN